MKFICGTCWILPSCSCALVEAESNSKERHAIQNRSLVCRVTYIFLGNETNISSEHSLTIFGKVTYTCQSANFVFHQRARCNRIYAFICFSSQNYWAVSKVCGKALMSVFFFICTIISPFSCLFLCSNESKTHNPGKQEDPIKKEVFASSQSPTTPQSGNSTSFERQGSKGEINIPTSRLLAL